MFKQASLLLCMILITVSMFQTAQAAVLEVTLHVDELYDLGEEISISGNLTLDGSPVPDGLVTIQIDDPQNNLTVLRTLNTGSTPSGPWPVEISEFMTCDQSGNPQSNFEAGEYVYIKINVTNNGATQQHVILTVNLYDSGMRPFYDDELHMYGVWWYERDFEPEDWITLIQGIPIPHDAELGQAFAYANVLSGWPKNGGYAFSPEKLTLFNIGTGGSGAQSTQEIHLSSLMGEFNLTFRTKSIGGRTGNYTVSAVSQYQYWFITNQTTFEVYLLGDVTGDGKVRVDDILAVAMAFGLNEGDPGWDPRYDLSPPPDGDGRIRVDDVLVVVLAFGHGSG